MSVIKKFIADNKWDGKSIPSEVWGCGRIPGTETLEYFQVRQYSDPYEAVPKFAVESDIWDYVFLVMTGNSMPIDDEGKSLGDTRPVRIVVAVARGESDYSIACEMHLADGIEEVFETRDGIMDDALQFALANKRLMAEVVRENEEGIF